MERSSRKHLFSFSQHALSLLALCWLTYGLHKTVLENNFQELSLIEHVSLWFSPNSDLQISNYAIHDSQGRFLIAGPTPTSIDLSLVFSQAVDAEFVVRGEYQQQNCRSGGYNKAVITIGNQHTRHEVALIDGVGKTIKFSAAAGEKLKLSVLNASNQGCGRARITPLERHHEITPLVIFFAVWGGAYLLCLALGLPAILSVYGAASQALMLSAESTLGMINIFNFWFSIWPALTIFGLLLVIVSSISSTLIKRVSACLIVFAALLVPLVFIAHDWLFSAPVSADSIHAVLQSYAQQAFEFWRSFVGYKNTLLVIILFVGAAMLVGATFRGNQKTSLPGLIVGFCCALLALPMMVVSADHSSSLSLIKDSLASYQKEILEFKAVANKRSRQAVSAELASKHVGDLSIFIIGESVNKNHMSAYGYPRQTTPVADRLIASGEMLKFTNSYSNHTHSNPTLSFMLTGANQYNGKRWLSTPSIFNVAKSAGVSTSWISNHRMLGGWSNHITVLAKEADYVETINKKIGRGNAASNYDRKLLPIARKEIARLGTQAIFLHFYNSHFDYCGRYPASINMFEDDPSAMIFGKKSRHRKINNRNLNCYDNTIYYTDSLIGEVIEEHRNSNRPTIVSYIADHADETFDVLAHNSAVFVYEMTDIPLLVWANAAWRKQHPEAWNNLVRNRDRVFTNDKFFDTALGIMGVQSQARSAKNDLSSNEYRAPDNPKTLHGKIRLAASTNHSYWQQQNAVYARKRDLQIGVAHADSVGRAALGQYLGATHLALSVALNELGELRVLNSDKQLMDYSLESYLNSINHTSLRKVWVHLDERDSTKWNQATKEIDSAFSKTSIDHEIIRSAEAPVLTLYTPEFSQQLEQLTRTKDSVLFVDIKSRYDF